MAQSGDNKRILQVPPAIIRIQRFVGAQANNRGWQTTLASARGSIAQFALGNRLMRQFADFGSQGTWSQEIFARFQNGDAQRDASALPLAPATRTGRSTSIVRLPERMDAAWPSEPAEPSGSTDTFAAALHAQGWSLETPAAVSSPQFEPRSQSSLPPAHSNAPIVARTASAPLQRQTGIKAATELHDWESTSAKLARVLKLPDSNSGLEPAPSGFDTAQRQMFNPSAPDVHHTPIEHTSAVSDASPSPSGDADAPVVAPGNVASLPVAQSSAGLPAPQNQPPPLQSAAAPGMAQRQTPASSTLSIPALAQRQLAAPASAGPSRVTPSANSAVRGNVVSLSLVTQRQTALVRPMQATRPIQRMGFALQTAGGAVAEATSMGTAQRSPTNSLQLLVTTIPTSSQSPMPANQSDLPALALQENSRTVHATQPRETTVEQPPVQRSADEGAADQAMPVPLVPGAFPEAIVRRYDAQPAVALPLVMRLWSPVHSGGIVSSGQSSTQAQRNPMLPSRDEARPVTRLAVPALLHGEMQPVQSRPAIVPPAPVAMAQHLAVVTSPSSGATDSPPSLWTERAAVSAEPAYTATAPTSAVELGAFPLAQRAFARAEKAPMLAAPGSAQFAEVIRQTAQPSRPASAPLTAAAEPGHGAYRQSSLPVSAGVNAQNIERYAQVNGETSPHTRLMRSSEHTRAESTYAQPALTWLDTTASRQDAPFSPPASAALPALTLHTVARAAEPGNVDARYQLGSAFDISTPQPLLQRAPAPADEVLAAPAAGGDAAGGAGASGASSGAGGQSVEALARKVYEYLRLELRIEQERSGIRSW